MPLGYKHSTRFSIVAELKTKMDSVIKKATMNTQSHKTMQLLELLCNSFLPGVLDSETRMDTFPRKSTDMKGSLSHWDHQFYPRRSRWGSCYFYTETKVGVR